MVGIIDVRVSPCKVSIVEFHREVTVQGGILGEVHLKCVALCGADCEERKLMAKRQTRMRYTVNGGQAGCLSEGATRRARKCLRRARRIDPSLPSHQGTGDGRERGRLKYEAFKLNVVRSGAANE